MTLHQKLAKVILQCIPPTIETPPIEATVKIQWSDEHSITLNVRAHDFHACDQTSPIEAIDMAPMQAAVLEVVAMLGPDERLSGEEIAKKAGYAFGGGFRACLSGLVKAGKIRCFGRNGYGGLPS